MVLHNTYASFLGAKFEGYLWCTGVLISP